MNIYVKTVSADAAKAMKHLETMCATREARKHTNYVEEAYSRRCLLDSTLNRVMEIWRRGGDSNPRYEF
jgi:hypothetical protein